MERPPIPSLVDQRITPKGRALIEKVWRFVQDECLPSDEVFTKQISDDPARRWKSYPPIIDSLKAKARAQGLWNLFLHSHYKEGSGLTNVEYAVIAEYTGRCLTAAEAMNCSAPDTGNMEVFAKYGSEEQKKRWLVPLLNGSIRSAFCMTERFVASSDARNVSLSMKRQGGEYILNGTKWWASGSGDPRCKVYLVLGKTNPDHPDPYKQQTLIIVDADAPGARLIRPLGVIGYDDAPHGHCEIHFENCRVSAENIVLGEGRGFEIIQGRLGPGRIHHCMRSVGAAEYALELMIARVTDASRKTFRKHLHEHDTVIANIAHSRIEIDRARLLVLNAACRIDEGDAKAALREIAMAKVVCPNMALAVIDRAMQAFGAAGISQDTPLARMWVLQRTLRYADGPDEVHVHQLGRMELKRAPKIHDALQQQQRTRSHLLQRNGLEAKL